MEEIFKVCVENYEVSNFGNVRRKMKTGDYRNVNCSIQNRGYRYFQLKREGKRINYLVHHLVAKNFIGDRPDGLVIDHIDRNKLNNNVSNLRYVTQGENCKNQDVYLAHIIETDPKKRACIISKIYAETHREEVLQKKREYYLKNKDKFKEYNQNQSLHIVKCSACNEERNVKRKMYNVILKKGIEKNICSRCASIKNLEQTHSHI